MDSYNLILNYVNNHVIPEEQYVSIVVNDIDVHIGKLKGLYWVCITKIHSALNCGTKSAENCAYKWFRDTIMDKGGYSTVINSADGNIFRNAKTGRYDSGRYIELNLDFVGLLYKTRFSLAARNWLNGIEGWDECSGKGWLYLIQLPSRRGTRVFKYGKTIYPIARWRVYLRNEPEEFRRLGILIFCLIFVENTSVGEENLGKWFSQKNGCRVIEGNEHFQVDSTDDEPFQETVDVVMSLFDKATGKMKVEDDGYMYDVDDQFETTNVFKLDKDKK